MFTVKGSFSDQFEISAPIEAVRDLFGDIKSFAELMPGVSKAHRDAQGVGHLTIDAEIPVVGTMTQRFAIEPIEEADDRIEWAPQQGETQNFLRYTADLMSVGAAKTLVRFAQAVELRRERARDFHFLAGMAGESLISNEMSRRFAEMASSFISRAKQRLETGFLSR